jgi:hypothetical protein
MPIVRARLARFPVDAQLAQLERLQTEGILSGRRRRRNREGQSGRRAAAERRWSSKAQPVP